LKKYSKVYFLNENYNAESLTVIPQQYVYSTTRTEQILTPVWGHLQSLLAAATSTGVTPLHQIGVPFIFEQASLKNATA